MTRKRKNSDSYYIRNNIYRRGSSDEENDDNAIYDEHDKNHVFVAGRLMDCDIKPHGKHKWSLTEQQVPRLLRRRYITSGYRIPHANYCFYLTSAFWLHNETINIWTHFAPFLWVSYQMYTFYINEVITELHYPLITLQLCTLALFFGSSIAHTFHSQSKYSHVCWFLLDFLTIAFFIEGIGVQRFNQERNNRIVEGTTTPILIENWYSGALLCASYSHFASTAYLFVHYPYMSARLKVRAPVSLMVAIFLYIPLYYRYSHSNADDSALFHHSMAFIWLIAAGVFMAAHVPERFCRGYFDLIGYGHQLFHLCTVMVALHLIEASNTDVQRLKSRYIPSIHKLATIFDLALPLIILTTFMIITMYTLVKTAKTKHC